jgi:hypothetical protein
MHRRTVLAAAGAGLILPSLATAQAVRRRVHRPPSAPPTLSGAPAEVTMTPWRTMPAVQAMVNGHGPYLFGIDTGFPGVLNVTPAVAQACGLAVVGQEQTSDPSGLNPVTIDTYRVPSLTLGGLTFSGMDAGAFPPLPSSIPGPLLDGLIGMGLFQSATLVFDFPGLKVAVTDAALPAPDQRTVFGYTPGDFIELPVTIGETVLPAHLDTGQSRRPLLVPQEALARLPVRGEPRASGTARTVSQTFTMYSVDIDAPVRVGEIALPVTEVSYPTPIPIANIGSRALERLVVKVDGRAGRVQFIPAAP